jgi:hypothetical protein
VIGDRLGKNLFGLGLGGLRAFVFMPVQGDTPLEEAGRKFTH